jgi:phage tail sheath protein FI
MLDYKSPGVYVEEVPSGSRPIEGVGTSTAAFVGVCAKGPFNEPVKVGNWAEYVRTFGEWVQDAYMPHAVYQFFNNRGGSAYIVRVGEGPEEPSRASAQLTSAVKAGQAVYLIEAKEPGESGEGIVVSVEPQPTNGESEGDGEGDGAPSDEVVNITVRQGDTVERFDGIGPRKGRNDLVSTLAASALVQAKELGSAPVAERLPSRGEVVLSGAAPLPAALTPDDYTGDELARTGIAGLSSKDDITILAVPDLMAFYERGQIDLDGVLAVQKAVIAHCEVMKDRMAILDPPKGMSPQAVREWVREKARFTSPYSVLYYPWISFWDPVTRGAKLLPPSAAMAGIWGRNDDTRGVHKAPANEVVTGALDLETYVTRKEHDDLNPIGVNVIRDIPGRGLVVWGARTLSSDAEWRYVNVRRMFNYIESSIKVGTQWVVFESNDLDLWQRIRRTISGFLLGMWRNGALFGATPEQAFYVKCDAETNPQDVIDAGYVVVEIGISPVKPAEFVVFRIQQQAGMAA